MVIIYRGLDDEEVTSHLPIGDPPEPVDDNDEEYDGEPLEKDDDEDEDEEFAEFDQILAEATAASNEEKRLKQARKRLAHILKLDHATKEDERISLLAEIRKLEEHRVWLTIGAVALFHTQECAVCGSKHAFFRGWMTEQKHATDPNARRLIAGKPVQRLPERREDHSQGICEMCNDCVEQQLAMNIAFGEAVREL